MLLLAASVSCTGSSPTPSPDEVARPQDRSAGATLDARPIPLSVQVTDVAGRLAKPRREAVVRSVGRVVSTYFDAGFLEHRSIDAVLASFAKGVRSDARRDRDLLTIAALAEPPESVTAKVKRAELSVLSPNGSPAGVTARVRLVALADRGDAGATRLITSGRLLLTRQDKRWQIFGYDVATSSVPVRQGGPR